MDLIILVPDMAKPVEAATIDGRVVDFWGARDFRDGLRDFWRVAGGYPLEAERIPVRELAEQFAVKNPDLLAACEVVSTIAYTFGRFDENSILQEGMDLQIHRQG